MGYVEYVRFFERAVYLVTFLAPCNAACVGCERERERETFLCRDRLTSLVLVLKW
jgi:hypothetical protein